MKWMRALLSILLTITLLTGCSAPSQHPVHFSAIVTSDLHYTSSAHGEDGIVPLVRYSRELTDAIVHQVIAEKPDVFLLTGDNTNSGRKEDEENLAAQLSEIKEAGIPIVMTTGNHDFNESDETAYQDVFFPLFDIDEKDPSSLSWVSEINGVTLLAMDDHTDSAGGQLSAETMQWLKKQLQKADAKGNPILFLSHHSVLSDEGNTASDYWIRNKDLKHLLQKYHVTLCLTGHQHAQRILEEDGIHEIISAIPASGSHQIGSLTIEGGNVSYHTMPIDFQSYGEKGMVSIVKDCDNKESQLRRKAWSSIFEKTSLSSGEQTGCMHLLEQFFQWSEDGVLALHLAEFQSDPYYELLMSAVKDTNYGPWIQSNLDHPPLNGSYLEFSTVD